MKRVTLGGDRLGSGKKQQVELHGYERSTHDLSYVWKSSMSAGTLVPFLVEIALPGDTFDIELDIDVLTHPTEGPLFGSYKVQADMFHAPIRLYIAQLHNNKLKVGMNMANVLLPQMTLLATPTIPAETADINTAQINPSCILAYLGVRGVGFVNTGVPADTATRKFNAVGILMYWDIYKNYYANKQEEIGAVIHTEAVALIETVDTVQAGPAEALQTVSQAPLIDYVGLNTGDVIFVDNGLTPFEEAQLDQIVFNTDKGLKTLRELIEPTYTIPPGATSVTFPYNAAYWGPILIANWDYTTAGADGMIPPRVVTFDLNNLDEMREYILANVNVAGAVNINSANLQPFSYILPPVYTGGLTNYKHTQEGLAIKTYQSDLFNNWIETEWIDGAGGITEVTSIDTTGGSFSIDQLNLQRKVYNYLNRVAVSGGSYNDWLEATYDHNRLPIVESPVYHGGLIKELVFQQVVSNSQTQEQPLGTLAGKGTLSNKHKGGHITMKFDEPSFVMGIISITPRVDYSQGNAWHSHLETMDNLHKPALDEIGFQELITEQMAWWDTQTLVAGAGIWTTRSAGKQPAWINYMTNINKAYGNFAIEANEMFMTLNRRYEFNGSGIDDLTTYIDPAKFNNIFAQTSLDAQNFWVQVGVNFTGRRKMSAKLMPNL